MRRVELQDSDAFADVARLVLLLLRNHAVKQVWTMEWNAAALGDIEVQVLVKYRMYKLGTNSLARAPIRTESVLLNCWRERERERARDPPWET